VSASFGFESYKYINLTERRRLQNLASVPTPAGKAGSRMAAGSDVAEAATSTTSESHISGGGDYA
jgi:hypothetical protein